MKTIFWNVDTANDFMYKSGKLYVNHAETIEDNLYTITKKARKYKKKVVNTGDLHDKDSKELSDNPDYKNTYPEHCMRGTSGADFIKATTPSNPYIIDWKDERFDENKIKSTRNIILYKDHFDIFQGNKHADRVVNLIKPDRAIVYGVATNVCVNYAVLGLLERGIEVYVPIDAIKELPNLPLEEVLDKWKDKGAKLITVNDLEKILQE